jgi:hypothetical protein
MVLDYFIIFSGKIRDLLTRAQNPLVVNNACLLIGATIDHQPLQPNDFDAGICDVSDLRLFKPAHATAHLHLLARIILFPPQHTNNLKLLAVKKCLANVNLSSLTSLLVSKIESDFHFTLPVANALLARVKANQKLPDQLNTIMPKTSQLLMRLRTLYAQSMQLESPAFISTVAPLCLPSQVLSINSVAVDSTPDENPSSTVRDSYMPRSEAITSPQLQPSPDVPSKITAEQEFNIIALNLQNNMQHLDLSILVMQLRNYHNQLNEHYTDQYCVARDIPAYLLKWFGVIFIASFYLTDLALTISSTRAILQEQTIHSKYWTGPPVPAPTNISFSFPNFLTLVLCKFNNTAYNQTVIQRPIDCGPSVLGILQLSIFLMMIIIFMTALIIKDPRYDNNSGLWRLPTALKDLEDTFTAYIDHEVQKVRSIPAADHTETDKRFLEVADSYLSCSTVAARKSELTNLVEFIEQTELPRLNARQQEPVSHHRYDNFSIFSQRRALAQQASGDVVDNAERGIRTPLLSNANRQPHYSTMAALRP